MLGVGGAYATGVGALWGVGARDCLWGVGRRTTGVAARGRAIAGELVRGEGRRVVSARAGGVATSGCWVPVRAWDCVSMAGAGSCVWACRDASRPPYSASMLWSSSRVEGQGMVLRRVIGRAWRGAVDLFKIARSAGVGGISIPHEQPLDSAAEVRICRSRLRRVESSWYIEMSRGGRGMSVTMKGHTGSCSMVRETPPEFCCPCGPRVLKPGGLKPGAEN